MKFTPLAVALVVYSDKIASVSAQDANGYTGTAYTLYPDANGVGACKDGSSAHNGGYGRYFNSVKVPSCQKTTFGSINECATFCQSKTNLDGHVGFTYFTHDNSCSCHYTIGTGPEGVTGTPEPDRTGIPPAGSAWDGLTFGGYWNSDRGVGAVGNHKHTNGVASQNARCYKRTCYGSSDPSCTGAAREVLAPIPTCAPTGSPTTSPSVSPTISPSTGSPTRPTTSPTDSPTTSPTTGTPTNSPSTGSPTKSPTDSPTTSIASLYYPDWSKSNGGCKNGGGQPMYMTLDRSTWMFETRNGCCLRYYGWMMNECEGTSGATLSSGLWFPDWAGSDDTCKNDGSEPEYMAMNPASWMFSTQLECCEANFGWMVNECLGSSDPNAGASNKWYMKWDAPFKCKQDCQGTGPSCGGLAASWDELFDTREACCAEKAAWNPTDCLVD